MDLSHIKSNKVSNVTKINRVRAHKFLTININYKSRFIELLQRTASSVVVSSVVVSSVVPSVVSSVISVSSVGNSVSSSESQVLMPYQPSPDISEKE